MVQPVVIERDQDGHIIGEKTGEAVAIYDPNRLDEFVVELQRQLEQANNGALERT